MLWRMCADLPRERIGIMAFIAHDDANLTQSYSTHLAMLGLKIAF